MKFIVDTMIWLTLIIFIGFLLIWSITPTTTWQGDRLYYQKMKDQGGLKWQSQ